MSDWTDDARVPGWPYEKVPAAVFNEGGKWKYNVQLDYSKIPMDRLPEGPLTIKGRLFYTEDGQYVDPGEAAEFALANATDNGTSGVTFRELHFGWTMFVPDPPNGWPVMVRGTRRGV